MRYLRLALFVLGVPLLASAQVVQQSPQSISVQDSGTACSVAGTCASWGGINPTPALTFQLTGTCGTCTVTFEATADGQTWFAVLVTKLGTGTMSTTTTTTGQYAVANSGVLGLRARLTARSSGGFNVSLTRGFLSTNILNPVFGDITFTGQALGSVTADCTAPVYSFAGDTNTGRTSTAADTQADCLGGSAVVTYSTAGTLASPVVKMTGTFPDAAGARRGLAVAMTSATVASGGGGQIAVDVNVSDNGFAGTGAVVGVSGTASTKSSGASVVGGNMGAVFGADGGTGSSTGNNIGGHLWAKDSSLRAVGAVVEGAGNTPVNIGGVAMAGAGTVNVPFLAALMTSADTLPTLASTVALVADNRDQTGDIFHARENGSVVLKVADGGVTTVSAATAPTSGGSVNARLLFGTDAGFGIYFGSGAPTISASQGSLYMRTDGSSTSTRVYVNTDGATAWTSLTSGS